MQKFNPYEVLGGMFQTIKGAALNRAVTELETYTLKPKNKAQEKNPIVKTRRVNVKDDAGQDVLIGGETVAVYRVANIEIHMDHDPKGAHQIQLFDPVTGNSTGKINAAFAHKSGLLKKLASGRNCWMDFGG